MFASFAALAFVLVSVASPISQDEAVAAVVQTRAESQKPTQELTVAGEYSTEVVRDSYGVTKKVEPVAPPAPVAGATSAGRAAPAAGKPDPGTAKAIAYDMVLARGWGEDQYNCLVSLWQKESGWNVFAQNPSSAAYGIPQALPGSKMASAGGDWATNPATQISWGLGYISGRYSNPCGAWGASQAKGWY
ncbi:MAG: lytic transglycosylase protein [Microbacteriaceae bacterium]|nr:lytic transglycosylase protein [Microbacteriaceae bacterium]